MINIISQVIFWTIVIMSYFIYREFKRSVDGKLRILMMELFLAKMWCYGSVALFYLLWDASYLHNWNIILLRIVCNLPMFIVMIRLLLFIKNK